MVGRPGAIAGDAGGHRDLLGAPGESWKCILGVTEALPKPAGLLKRGVHPFVGDTELKLWL